jgi:hypothetical protein
MNAETPQNCDYKLDIIFYDITTHLLEVEFAGGEVYEYVAVPYYLSKELMRAKNKEEFFEFHIRNAFQSKQIV